MTSCFETNFNDYEVCKMDPYYMVNLKEGKIINGKSKRIVGNSTTLGGYKNITIKGLNVPVHRLMYIQAYNCIPTAHDVHHRDGNPSNNSISNLQTLTHRDNTIIASQTRDYTYMRQGMRNRARKVKAIKFNDEDEVLYFNSMHSCSRFLNINIAIIKFCCDGFNNCISGYDKITGERWRFEID